MVWWHPKQWIGAALFTTLVVGLLIYRVVQDDFLERRWWWDHPLTVCATAESPWGAAELEGVVDDLRELGGHYGRVLDGLYPACDVIVDLVDQDMTHDAETRVSVDRLTRQAQSAKVLLPSEVDALVVFHELLNVSCLGDTDRVGHIMVHDLENRGESLRGVSKALSSCWYFSKD